MKNNNFILGELIRQSQLGAGNNDIDGQDPEVAPPPELKDDGTVIVPEQLDNVPPVTVDTCALQEEVALVEAATEAINAECTLVEASDITEAAEVVVDAAEAVVVESCELRASMESFLGSPMTKQDAFMLQQRVVAVTRGEFEGSKLTGSLEDFGTTISVDEAMDAGLEGLGNFIKAAIDKLGDARRNFVGTFVNYFKQLKVTNQKVLNRAEAVKKIAARTTGDSNSSSIQIPVDTGWWLTVDGGVPKNLSKAVGDFSGMVKSVLKDAPEQLAEDRKKFIEAIGDLANADLATALKTAEKVVAWQPAFPVYAKTKVPGGRVCEVQRSAEMFGNVALYVGMPPEDDAKRYSMSARLNRVWGRFQNSFVELNEVTARPGKLDLAIDTLKPAEIVKLADDVINLLVDIDTYRTSWDLWLEENNELDRVITILKNVGWTGGDTVKLQDYGYGVGVTITNLSQDMANALRVMNIIYGYLTITPLRLVSDQTVSVLNRVLEVCELSIATYSDNSLK